MSFCRASRRSAFREKFDSPTKRGLFAGLNSSMYGEEYLGYYGQLLDKICDTKFDPARFPLQDAFAVEILTRISFLKLFLKIFAFSFPFSDKDGNRKKAHYTLHKTFFIRKLGDSGLFIYI